MTFQLGPCSHPGCSFSHSVHYVRPARSTPRSVPASDLGSARGYASAASSEVPHEPTSTLAGQRSSDDGGPLPLSGPVTGTGLPRPAAASPDVVNPVPANPRPVAARSGSGESQARFPERAPARRRTPRLLAGQSAG